MFIYHKSLSLVDLMSAQKVYGQDFKINYIIINAFTKIYFLILNHIKSDKLWLTKSHQ